MTGGQWPVAGLADALEEADVVGEEVADVVDAVFEHGDALGAHAEGETAEDGGVVAAVLEDDGMDHAGAEDFEPAGVLADAATFGLTEDAAGVDSRR